MKNIKDLKDGNEYRLGFIQIDIVGHSKLSKKYPGLKIQQMRENLRKYFNALIKRNKGDTLNYAGDGGIFFFAIDDLEKDFDSLIQIAVDFLDLLKTFIKNKIDGNILDEDIKLRISCHSCHCIFKTRYSDISSSEINEFFKNERYYGQVNGIGITDELYRQIYNNRLRGKFIRTNKNLFAYNESLPSIGDIMTAGSELTESGS